MKKLFAFAAAAVSLLSAMPAAATTKIQTSRAYHAIELFSEFCVVSEGTWVGSTNEGALCYYGDGFYLMLMLEKSGDQTAMTAVGVLEQANSDPQFVKDTPELLRLEQMIAENL